MSNEYVSVAREGAIATVTLSRAAEYNTMTQACGDAVRSAVDKLAYDKTCRAVVLAAEGKIFSAGADLNNGFPDDISLRELVNSHYFPLLNTLRNMPQPVVCALHGSAAGVSMSLALACDYIVMADSAALVPAFCRIGLVPDGGASWLLLRSLGYAKAFDYFAFAKPIPAAECLQAGLVNEVVSATECVPLAKEKAKAFAELAPLALSRLKRLLHQAESTDYANMVMREAELQHECALTNDFKEGVEAFLNKRKPEFRGQ